MRIGVIADTHIPTRARSLPDEVARHFIGVDRILHAGDLVTLSVLFELEGMAPVTAVAGNMDHQEVIQHVNDQELLELEGVRIGLVHGHVGRGRTTPQRAASHFPRTDVVVFGHSHMPLSERRGGQLLFNPGSATDRRQAPFCSVGILEVAHGDVQATIQPLQE